MTQNSFSETLQKERARLLNAANDWFEDWAASGDKRSLDVLLAEETAKRRSIDEVLKRHADGMTKDELLKLQSALYEALSERFQRGIKDYCERRFKNLADQARHDSLTGLLNRAAFEERMNEEVARALRYGRQLALVMFDVDDFKSVNDRFGHQAGDRVLVHVARVLRSLFRLSDPVFRYGGDEFVALCPEATGVVIENALKRIDNHRMTAVDEEEFVINVRISWGIASLPSDAVNAFDLIQLADQKLYSLKRQHHRQSAA